MAGQHAVEPCHGAAGHDGIVQGLFRTLRGEDQGHGPDKAFGVIVHTAHRAVYVAVGKGGQVFLHRPLDRHRVPFGGVENFNSVEPAVHQHRFMDAEPFYGILLLGGPTRVIPDHEGAHMMQFGHGGHKCDPRCIVQFGYIGVGDEEGIDMAGRHFPGHLNSRDHQDSPLSRLLVNDGRGGGIIARNEVLMGPVIVMVRDGDGIQTVGPCFVEADPRPDLSVGKDGVHVEIAFQGDESIYGRHLQQPAGVTEFHFREFPAVQILCGGGKTGQKKKGRDKGEDPVHIDSISRLTGSKVEDRIRIDQCVFCEITLIKLRERTFACHPSIFRLAVALTVILQPIGSGWIRG